MDSRSNRRNSVRYGSVTNRASFAWRVGEATTQAPARIMDISQGGAAILIEEQPPLRASDSAWLRIEQPSPSEWAECKVVDVEQLTKKGFWRRGEVLGHLIRVTFNGFCPYDLFKAATHGAQLDATFKESGTSEADRVIWR